MTRLQEGDSGDWEGLYLGPAPWGTAGYGDAFVILEGPGFFDEAEWLWEEQGDQEMVAGDGEDFALFLVTDEALESWSQRLSELPKSGIVRTKMVGEYESLLRLIENALSNPDVGLSVQCLL